jgi:hypothetical protein
MIARASPSAGNTSAGFGVPGPARFNAKKLPPRLLRSALGLSPFSSGSQGLRYENPVLVQVNQGASWLTITKKGHRTVSHPESNKPKVAAHVQLLRRCQLPASVLEPALRSQQAKSQNLLDTGTHLDAGSRFPAFAESGNQFPRPLR